MEQLEEKYIDLLLKRCLNFKKSKSLFIHYDVINKPFVEKLIEKAKEMGIEDIGIDEEDIHVTHEKLKNMTLEEIEKDPFFNKNLWNDYALKDASFLMLETEFPHFMDDIDPECIAKARFVNRSTREIFRKKEITYQISWCIAALPNEYWANDIFKEDPNAYKKLFDAIMKICMVDTENPIQSWNDYLKQAAEQSKKLDALQIKKMHYKNSLGTDLVVEMPNDCCWNSAASESKEDMLVNMPSYEIFCSPNYTKTEGIVYSSRPLIYGGGIIDEFYLEFSEGKVVNYDAKIGKEILKGIIESDERSCYLGEVALVNYDSPISNTGLVFGTTLIDENAACHLALGEGFGSAIEGGLDMTSEELLKRGINQSQQHVDFMIGTSDLEIEIETQDGKKQKIFKNGNFNI